MSMNKKKREIEIDFELNIASVIDCFTVLIVYLLLSASFITLGVLDVQVAAATNDGQETIPDTAAAVKLTMTIGVQGNNDIKIKTEGTDSKTYNIPSKNGAKDFETL